MGLGSVLRAEAKYNDFPFAVADVDKCRLIVEDLFSIQKTTHKWVASGIPGDHFEIESRGL